MAITDIGEAVASDLSNAVSDFKVDAQSTDGIFEQKETTWINEKWEQYFGYYNEIPELGTAIDAKATWTIGKGYIADEEITLQLDTIRGWGKDTFNTILENLIRTSHIGGDGFAEIIRDEEGNLINLKTLDPASVQIVVGRDGILKRYEQISKTKGNPNKKFQPDQIFHLARNRVADNIHGTSVITKCEKIILQRNEAMEDWKRVLHRNVDPMIVFHLDSDDPTKIAAFKKKTDAARGKGEHMYIPKDAVVPEVINIAPNASLNPLPWIESLNNYFYEAVGVPKVVIGNAQNFTDGATKMVYLSFEQRVREEQLFIKEQILSQLNIVLDLEFPASLENDLVSGRQKDVENGATKPDDTNIGGKTDGQENTK